MSQHGCGERMSYTKGFQEDGGSQATMEVLVETLTGTAFEMTVSPSDTVLAIKSKICRVEGIPVAQQHLLFNLRELEDSASLLASGVADGSRLRLVLGMRGGPISTRRLPPPQEPWRDIERLLDSNRDDPEWGGGGGGSCKVTVLVFRDGERVNMLRVRENTDGTYSPLEHKYSASTSSSCEGESAGVATDTSLQGLSLSSAVTHAKMADLRRRMAGLELRKRNGSRAEIQKTRSEETLSVPSLLEPPDLSGYPTWSDGGALPLSDGCYTRYDYDCDCFDRYTLLPPIGRTDSDQSVQDAVTESEQLKVSSTAGGSLLLRAGRGRGGDEARGGRLDSDAMAAIPAGDYGGVVHGAGWRLRTFGSHSQLSSLSPLSPLPPLAPLPPLPSAGLSSGLSVHSRSASSLAPLGVQMPAPRGKAPVAANTLVNHHHQERAPLSLSRTTLPPLSSLPASSSSTSDLSSLRRHRAPPGLSRHRNTEHLHLQHLDHRIQHLDDDKTGSERRLDEVAEADARLLRCGDFEPTKDDVAPVKVEEKVAEGRRLLRCGDFELTKDDVAPIKVEEKPRRSRCGVCRRRLTLATLHRCRCGDAFCAPHRYKEVHGCAYDYKAANKQEQRCESRVDTRLPRI